MFKTVFKNKYAVVKLKTRKNKPDYTIVKVRPGVVIVPITNNNKIILVEQFRETQEKKILELPAGLKDRGGETVLQTAKRELLEETGYTAKTWVSLGRFSIAPNIVATKVFILLALGATRKLQLTLEEGIKHHEYSLEEIEKLIREKQLTDAVSIAGIYAAKIHLKAG